MCGKELARDQELVLEKRKEFINYGEGGGGFKNYICPLSYAWLINRYQKARISKSLILNGNFDKNCSHAPSVFFFVQKKTYLKYDYYNHA